MKFKKVTHCNLDKLALAYKNIVNSKDISVKYFGEKDLFYFKTLKISYMIEGVSDLDLIIFDKLGALVTICSNNINLPNFEPSVLADNEITGTKIWNLYQSIDNRDKEYLLPINFRLHDVIIEFTGSSVINLLGLNPIQTLKVDKDFNLPSQKILEEVLFELLYKRFYLSMDNNLSSVDLLTDVTLQNQYYKFVDSKNKNIKDPFNNFNIDRSYDIALASVNTPVGSLNFLDSNKTSFSNNLNIIKSNLTKYNIDKESDSIEYLFVLESDFDTFMKLFIDTSFIINYEDLKVILFNGNRILSKDPSLLEINLIEIVNNHVNLLKDIYNDDIKYNDEHKKEIQLGSLPKNRVNKLELYSWICGCTQIRYMIKVNYNNLENYFERLNKINYNDYSLINLSSIVFDIRKQIYTVKNIL